MKHLPICLPMFKIGKVCIISVQLASDSSSTQSISELHERLARAQPLDLIIDCSEAKIEESDREALLSEIVAIARLESIQRIAIRRPDRSLIIFGSHARDGLP